MNFVEKKWHRLITSTLEAISSVNVRWKNENAAILLDDPQYNLQQNSEV